MFSKSNIRHKTIVLTLLTMLLVGGIFLASPASAPVAYAQSSTDLSLFVTGPTYIQPGAELTYEFKLVNHTSQAYTNISFYNDLFSGITYVSGGELIDADPDYVVLTIPNLAPNATETVTWVARADSSLAVGTVLTNINYGPLNTPAGAVIGYGSDPATLIEAPGTVVASYKNAAGTSFDVKLHGYQFENYGSTEFTSDDLSAVDVFEYFGPASCQSGSTAEDCVLSGPAQQWLTNYALKASNGGHCDGFSASSVSLFIAKPFRNYSTPSTFQTGAATTSDLTHPYQPIENFITHNFLTQDFIHWDDHIVGTPVDLVNRLIEDFNQTPSKSYALFIFKTNNLNQYNDSDFAEGHSIVPIGIEEVSASESRILVYDNNYPLQRQYVTVDMVNNTWRYSTAATPGQDSSAYVGTAVSGNLRLAPFDLRFKPEGEYHPCPFCNGETFPASANKVTGAAPGMVSGEIEFEFTGEGAMMVVNDHGERTGADPETGEFVNEIPDAEIEHFMGGLGKDIAPGIRFPFEEHDDTFYSVIIHGTTVENPTNGSLSIHGPGFAIGVYDIELDADNVFEFIFSPDGDHISFDATEDLVAPEIYIAHDPINPGDPSVIFDVEDLFLEAGEKLTLDLDPVLEQIHFGHTGPEAEDFIIDMKLIWPDGDVQDYAETVHIPAGVQTAFIDFGAWDGLLHPPTYIGGVLQNPSVNHRLKLIDAVGTYDPTPQTDAPAGVYHVEATFQNVTEVSFADAYFTVANLSLGDVLLNADAGSLGTRVSVPADALGDDGILHMNESFTFSFAVGLADTNFADLTVDANGVPHDWVHPDPEPSYDANNASFIFDGQEALPNQLGLMAADVQALADAGQLNQRDAARLLQNLDRAEQLIADGQSDRQVVRQLQMFLARIRWDGDLADEAKVPLMAQAEFLVQQLQIQRTR